MPTKKQRQFLDEIKQREIQAIVAVGCSKRTAAAYVGCSPSTICRTEQRDEDFASRLKHAAKMPIVTHMKNINEAAKKPQNWRASAWVLERLQPGDYAKRKLDALTIPQVLRLLSQLAEIVAEEVPVDRYRKNILKRLTALKKCLKA